MALKSAMLFVLFLSISHQLPHGSDAGCPFSKHLKESLAKVYDGDVQTKVEPDPETTTPNGCTCTSVCGTTIDAADFRYDWCSTNENCGEHSLIHGWWDKCLYLDSSKPDYIALGWEEKQAQMWSNIIADNSIAPYPNPAAILVESMKTTFDDEWDVMPAGRSKYIHSVGSVCPFVVKIADSPFTGLFQNGETHGMIRLGSAAGIDEKSGVTPGGGVKFFRSGRSSANFVILNQLGPIVDNNYNFMAVPLFNHISDDAPAALIPVAIKFCQAQSCPTKVGLSDVCAYDQEGNEAESVVFPFKVSFVPTGDINFREEYSDVAALQKQFEDIEIGTTIYTLRGHQSPEDEEGWLIGNVVTTDKCVTSLYGDTTMFFKHQYINEDKALKPEWTDAYDAECTPYCIIPP